MPYPPGGGGGGGLVRSEKNMLTIINLSEEEPKFHDKFRSGTTFTKPDLYLNSPVIQKQLSDLVIMMFR